MSQCEIRNRRRVLVEDTIKGCVHSRCIGTEFCRQPLAVAYNSLLPALCQICHSLGLRVQGSLIKKCVVGEFQLLCDGKTLDQSIRPFELAERKGLHSVSELKF